MSNHHPPVKAGNSWNTLMSRCSAAIELPAKAFVARLRSATFNSLGITLIETVIALAIFSSAGTAVLMGVGAAHTSSDRVKASAIAENLARNQMEYVSTLSYVTPPGSYASIADDVNLNITLPTGFGVSAAAETYVADDGFNGSIEKVVVTVTRDGQSIFVLESLRSGP